MPLDPHGRPLRPVGLTVLAIFDLVVALPLLAGAAILIAVATREHSPGMGALAAGAGAFLLIVGGLHGAAAVGILRLRPWGRWLQIAASVLGLLFACVGTLASAVVLVYVLMPGMKTLFERRRMDAMSEPEQRSVASMTGTRGSTIFLVTLGLVLFLGVFLQGIVSAIAVPNFLAAVQRGKQKRTMADMRTMATAIESRAVDVDAYPGDASIGALRLALEPTYAKALPTQDGWARTFDVSTRPNAYVIRSFGRDGVPDGADPWAYESGPVASPDDDLVFSNGTFVRWAESSDRP